MIKSLKLYLILSVLLHGGHFFLMKSFPEKISFGEVFYTQSFITLIFLLSDALILIASKFLEVYKGQAFLITTTLKILLAGCYFLVIKLTGLVVLSKVFILLFMLSYFVYLSVESVLTIKSLNAEGDVGEKEPQQPSA